MFYKPKSIVIAPIIIGLVLCVMQMDSFGQRGNMWCFGDSAGINFNTSPPTTFITSVKSRGSCASISDSLGQLMIYSYTRATVIGNTTKVYNKTHSLMNNGDNIVGQGWYYENILIPSPSNLSEYYLFSIGVTNSGLQGLYYSTIDMSLSNGLGSVTQKNIQLLNFNADDGLTAVKHGNGRDWWVFFRKASLSTSASNTFYKYLITPTGIAGPDTQSIGAITYINSYQYFFSNDGSKFGCVGYQGLVETYDFDRCTGILSNNRTIRQNFLSGPYPGGWSGEFSKDKTKLYVSDHGIDSYLLQFNLSDSLPSTTVDTIAHFNYPQYTGGMLKLAPDNKIYWSCAWINGSNFNYPYPDSSNNMYNMNLSVINSPDSLGAACDFQPYSFYLGGGRTYWGLPNNPNYDLGPLAGSSCDTLTVGLNEIAAYKNNLAVYYDAGWQMAFVNAKGLKGKNAILKLFNLNGQLITTLKGTSSGEYFTADVNMQGLANGMYIFQLSTDREVLTGKVIK
jgi:hypothetical protein